MKISLDILIFDSCYTMKRNQIFFTKDNKNEMFLNSIYVYLQGNHFALSSSFFFLEILIVFIALYFGKRSYC